jgi:hypothetical protein
MVASIVVALSTVVVRAVVPMDATDVEKKLAPVRVMIVAGELTSAPGGHTPPARMLGTPAVTANVTLTVTLLLAAVAEAKTSLPV